jgi:hypothetical protein
MTTCQKNHLRYDDVVKSLGGLYHRASADLHGHDEDVIVDEKSWTPNEIVAIGSLFNFYRVPFLYVNADGDIVSFPYKL